MAIRSKTTPKYLSHNKVKLIRGGAEYFKLLEQMIDEAAESIHLQYYIFDEDETGTAIANALIKAAERNVKVYILVDAHGSQGLSREFIDRMKKAGVFFRTFEPLFKSKRFYLGRRLHHKIVVVDSYRSTVAGLNISNRYNDTPEAPAWLDWVLYAEGEVSAALEDVCKSRLKLKRNAVVKTKSHAKPKEVCKVGVRENDWIRRKREVYDTYLKMFQEAKTDLTIMSPYFLPGRKFRRSIEAAASRGVKIKAILSGYADIPLIKYAERYIYDWLFRNNVEIYEYRKNVLHGKMVTCDGEWMTVGSFNVNNLSAFASVELNLDVHNRDFTALVEHRLDQIIRNDCVHVTEESFKRDTNIIKRMGRKLAYETFRFMFFLSTKQA
jgi:cardiolipin synthase A/B